METTTTDNGLEITLADWDLTKHDCTVTLVSPKTGDHRTFKVSTVQKGKLEGKRIVSLLVGPDNEADFEGIGFVESGTFMDKTTATVIVWRKFQCRNGMTSMCERYADMLMRPDFWSAKGVQYLISLRCRRCHRKLTVPSSIESGYGPECIKHV